MQTKFEILADWESKSPVCNCNRDPPERVLYICTDVNCISFESFKLYCTLCRNEGIKHPHFSFVSIVDYVE